MWKPKHWVGADQRELHYRSHLIDAEWDIDPPLIRPAKRGERHAGLDGVRASLPLRPGIVRRSPECF